MRQTPFKRMEQILNHMTEDLEEARMGFGGEIGTAAIDLAEWDGEFLVIADMPGFEEEDIEVRLHDQTLHITAEHKAEREPEIDRYLERERAHESVSRTVEIPEEVDEDEVSATYENGVLTVALPKAHFGEEEESHRIEIE